MPCDALHLSRVVHGRKRSSLRMAARLDDVLEAAGEATYAPPRQETRAMAEQPVTARTGTVPHHGPVSPDCPVECLLRRCCRG